MAHVTQATSKTVEDLVGAAPADLDTLVELAAAIGDDADFLATLVTAGPQHATTLAELWDGLIALGLLDETSAPPA